MADIEGQRGDSGRRQFFEWRLSIGNIVTILGMIIGGLSMWYGLGERVAVLEAGQRVHENDIVGNAARLTVVESRAGDVRERLRGIEVTQQQQSHTLDRILQAVEGDARDTWRDRQ